MLRLRLAPAEAAALRARVSAGDVSEYVRRALGLVDAPEGPGVAWELLSALRPEVVGAMVARYGIEAVAAELERRAGSLRALAKRVRTAHALGVSREDLSNVDFICWIHARMTEFRAANRLGDGRITEAAHDAFTAFLWAQSADT